MAIRVSVLQYTGTCDAKILLLILPLISVYRWSAENRCSVENKTTAMAINISAMKDPLKVAAAAMNPIDGGPMRKPMKPKEDTAVIAMPGAMVVD